MPTRYLDYDASGRGNGSRRNPWHRWVDVVWEPGIEIIVSGSSVPNFPVRTLVKGIDNIRIRRDEGSPRPTCSSYRKSTDPGQWVEVEPRDGITAVSRPGSTNLWRNKSLKGTVSWMAFGRLDAVAGFVDENSMHRFHHDQRYQRQLYFRQEKMFKPEKHRPKRYGQWDSHPTMGVYVYSEGNPVSSNYYDGNIWYQSWQHVLHFNNCNGVSVEGLGFRHGFSLVKISNSISDTTIREFLFRDVRGSFCQFVIDLTGGRGIGMGPQRAYLDDVLIEDVHGRYIGETFIRLINWLKNVEVRQCSGELCGVLQSSAAFYIGNLYVPDGFRVRVHDLTLRHWGFGARWPTDGSAVYIDSSQFDPDAPGPAQGHGAYCDFYDMDCRHGKYGAIFNAGQKGIRLFRNVFHDTETLIDVRDARQVGHTDIECANNTLVAPVSGRYPADPSLDQVAAVRIRPTKFNGRVRIRNNIIVGNGSANYLGMVDRSTKDGRNSHLVDSNNQFYACASVKVNRTGKALAQGPGNNTADPMLFDAKKADCRLRSGSPCIDSGESLEGITDVDGRGIFRQGRPDRGARFFSPPGNPTRHSK